LLAAVFWGMKQKKDMFSWVMVLAIILLISGPWYFSFLPDLLRDSKIYQGVGTVVERDPAAFMPSLVWYFQGLRDNMFSPVLFAFLCLGLLLFLMFEKRLKVLGYLFLWAVPAFVILVLYPNKDGRYLMPILPVASFVTIGGIRTLKSSWVRRVCYGGVLLSGFLLFIQFSFVRIPFLGKMTMLYYNSYPSAEKWKIPEILGSVSKYAGEKNALICVLPDAKYFNANDFMLYVELLGQPYRIRSLGHEVVSDDYLRDCDLLLMTDPLLSAEWTASLRKEFQKEFNNRGSEAFGFRQGPEFGLPNGIRAVLYENLQSQLLN
jgi:hypothetical protein